MYIPTYTYTRVLMKHMTILKACSWQVLNASASVCWYSSNASTNFIVQSPTLPELWQTIKSIKYLNRYPSPVIFSAQLPGRRWGSNHRNKRYRPKRTTHQPTDIQRDGKDCITHNIGIANNQICRGTPTTQNVKKTMAEV